MSRSAVVLVASLGLVALAGTAALTVTPASHDFGDATVNPPGPPTLMPAGGSAMAQFRIAMPRGAPSGTTLSLAVTGADAGDFFVWGDAQSIDIHNSNSAIPGATLSTYVSAGFFPAPPSVSCTNNALSSYCDVIVVFQPLSVGPKTATLEASDNQGNRGTAQLKGKGVKEIICEMKVVPCNYARLWTGSFGWRSVLNSPGTQYTETVDVNILSGVAVCGGAATARENGRSLTGLIGGTGLLAVEFLEDPTYDWVYRITVACPTPDWPATSDAAAIPARPAELGQNEYSSDKQPMPTTAAGMRVPMSGQQLRTMTLQHRIASTWRLSNSISYPSPDTDALNQVTGTVSVTWDLQRPPPP